MVPPHLHKIFDLTYLEKGLRLKVFGGKGRMRVSGRTRVWEHWDSGTMLGMCISM